MNLRLDVTYELALESRARIRKRARTQWAAGLDGASPVGQEAALEPAAERGAPTELCASLARDGGAI